MNVLPHHTIMMSTSLMIMFPLQSSVVVVFAATSIKGEMKMAIQ
jgi:hypothetical protein